MEYHPLSILIGDLYIDNIYHQCDRTIVEDTFPNNLPLVLTSVRHRFSCLITSSPTQCKVSFRSYLHVIISKVVFSIWKVTVWPEAIYHRYCPSVATHFQFTTPRVALRFKITLTRGWTIPNLPFPLINTDHHDPKYAHLTPFTESRRA
jgi:hypothetical protein